MNLPARILPLALYTLAASLWPTASAHAQETPAELRQWPCGWLREHSDQRKPRFFSSNAPDKRQGAVAWSELTSAPPSEGPGAPKASASMWRHAYGTLVNITFRGHFGPSVEYVSYCFRDDDTLAQVAINAQLPAAEPSPVRVVRRTAYLRTGEVETHYERVRDLATNRSLELEDVPKVTAPLFLTVQELPLWEVIDKRSAADGPTPGADCADAEDLVKAAWEQTTSEPEQAAGVFRELCDKNCAAGCEALAYAYSVGLGVKKSDRKSARAYKKTCALAPAQCE